MSFLVLFACMRLFVLFVLVKFYRKKKIKRFEITPDNPIHYTTFGKIFLERENPTLND